MTATARNANAISEKPCPLRMTAHRLHSSCEDTTSPRQIERRRDADVRPADSEGQNERAEDGSENQTDDPNARVSGWRHDSPPQSEDPRAA